MLLPAMPLLRLSPIRLTIAQLSTRLRCGECGGRVFGALVGVVEVAVLCLAVYGIVRAIGWVIGGFAAVLCEHSLMFGGK